MNSIISTVKTRTLEIAEITACSIGRSFIIPLINIALMLVVRYSEPLLKGKETRSRLEHALADNLRAGLNAAGEARPKIQKPVGGILFVTAENEGALIRPLIQTLGVSTVAVSVKVKAVPEEIYAECVKAGKNFQEGSSFAIKAKKVEGFPMPSPELAAKCGEAVLDAYPEKKLKVNLKAPDNTIFVDAKQDFCLVSGKILKGYGGMPVGTQGKAVVLCHKPELAFLATWMLAKRGFAPVLLCDEKIPGKEITGLADKLKSWMHGVPLRAYSFAWAGYCESFDAAFEVAKLEGAKAIITDELFEDFSRNIEGYKKLEGIPVYRPLLPFSRGEAEGKARELLDATEIQKNAPTPKIPTFEIPPGLNAKLVLEL